MTHVPHNFEIKHEEALTLSPTQDKSTKRWTAEVEINGDLTIEGIDYHYSETVLVELVKGKRE